MHNLVDLDNDGDFDLVTSEYTPGILTYYENNNGVYTIKTDHSLTGLDLGSAVKMDFTDLDGDGDLDLTTGSYNTENNNEAISYYENIGTINNSIFVRKQGADNFFDSVISQNIAYGVPAFNDVNNDGILDFVTSRGPGSAKGPYLLPYYEGTGNIVKVKTTHYQDMDGITTIDASDKLTEHFIWNRLDSANKYVATKDATINNFDLFNDTLNFSVLLANITDDSKSQHASIRSSNNAQDSILSIDGLNITLTGVTSDLDNLLSNGTLILQHGP